MEAYGFADWDGNDRHFMGWAGTGVHFDPLIASNAAHWLPRTPARRKPTAARPEPAPQDPPPVRRRPWFLTVALVNPHDVMWFPVDQPGYRERHPDDVASIRSVLESAAWKDDDPLPVFTEPYPEVVDRLPANFDDDLHTKPEAHRQWRWDQQHGLWGYIDPSDKGPGSATSTTTSTSTSWPTAAWARCSAALEASGAWDDTVIIFTSDHGDMCGSHGLRSKGPFVYDEIMRVPLYVKAPGVTTPGSVTSALGSHVDLAATICSLAGVDPATSASHRAGDRPHPGAGRPVGHGARPHPVRPGLGPDHRSSTRCATPCGASTTAAPSTPATTGWAGASRPPGCGGSPRAQALRRRLRLRRQRPRVVRPRHRSPGAGQPGQRPRPPTELRDVYERMRAYEQESFVTFDA
jgi:hypothetical protein